MDNNFSKTLEEVLTKYISNKKKELFLISNLLDVQNGVKSFNGCNGVEYKGSLVSAFQELDECSSLLTAFVNNPDDVEYLKRLTEKAKIIQDHVGELKQKTHFFRTIMDFGDILSDLEKATTKFLETTE